MKDKIDALKAVLGNLGSNNAAFGLSLIQQFQKRGKLSDKQWFWVEKLVADANKPKPEPVVVSVGSFKRVMDLFARAREHLKWPKINLQVNDQPIMLSVAGPAAKKPGTVNVTDGGPYGQNKWFGRVTPEGEWEVNMRAPQESLAEVEGLLLKLARKPAETAKEYGRLTGRCCFCNKKLTDERSTAAGFGETCAQHYGLHSEWKSAVAVLENEEVA